MRVTFTVRRPEPHAERMVKVPLIKMANVKSRLHLECRKQKCQIYMMNLILKNNLWVLRSDALGHVY